jgi:hypothetical protein
MRLGADWVKEANAERLRREFTDLSFKSGESVEDFSLRLNTVVSQLRALGDEVSDKDVIKRIFHAVPDHLEQVAISMETLLDLKELSIEEAMGHMRAIEQRSSAPHGGVDGPYEVQGGLRLQHQQPCRRRQQERRRQRWRQKQGSEGGRGNQS